MGSALDEYRAIALGLGTRLRILIKLEYWGRGQFGNEPLGSPCIRAISGTGTSLSRVDRRAPTHNAQYGKAKEEVIDYQG